MRNSLWAALAVAAVLLGLSSSALAEPASLRGSLQARARENAAADKHGLERYANFAAMREAQLRGDIRQVVGNDVVAIADELGEHDQARAGFYAYARPWVLLFLTDLSGDAYRPAGAKLQVTSLVRTVEYQRALRGASPNAARGKSRARLSSHLTGSTVDISTKDMSPSVKNWLRAKLLDLERRGLVQATEEKRGSMCFHVMVFPEYRKK